MIKDKVVAFFVSRNHVEYASSCGSNPVLELAARHLGKVRIKESAFHGQRIMATQLDSVQISQLKALALGLEYDVS